MNRLSQITQRWRGRFEPRVLILMYHRVTESGCDPWALCVSPEHFDQQLQVIRRHTRAIQVQQLSKYLVNGTVPRSSVAITFDDGYVDNVQNAKPLLERHDLPATFFLVSKFLGSQAEFWWDELDRILLRPGILPKNFSLDINGNSIEIDLEHATNYSNESYRDNRNWRAWEDPPTPRHSLYYSLWKRLRSLPDSDRQETLRKLSSWANADSQARPGNRALSLSELSAIGKESLIEVACHTETHPQLSLLPASIQRDEIHASKARLEEILGRPVKSFAYPYGSQDDYTAETVAIVRENGFTSACSTSPGVVTKHSDLFQLPRVPVEDWNGEEFAKRLSDWFGGD